MIFGHFCQFGHLGHFLPKLAKNTNWATSQAGASHFGQFGPLCHFEPKFAKKHKLDLIKRNLKTNEFKALHLCSAGDLWNFGRLTK